MLNVISFSNLRGSKALFVEILKIFNATLDAEGQSLWIHQFHKKSTQEELDRVLIPSIPFNQIKIMATEFLAQFLEHSKLGKVKYLIRKGFHGSALVSSGIFGALLPPNDLVFFSKSQKKDTLTLAHASTFSSELVLEWLHSVVQRTKIRAESSESLSSKAQVVRFFSELEALLAQFNVGLKTGSIFRNSGSIKIRKWFGKPLPEIRIPVDNRAYQIIDSFFSNLNSYRNK